MTKPIMIQGTASNAGKSIITAGLCRIFFEDGHRVAPFKSQNISLNSFVTRDSLEMGRAQAVQAAACEIEPDVRMNPVLIKPSSGVGSQIIVMGKPIGNINYDNQRLLKENLKDVIKNAYESLSAEYDIIVIEGAGSPAEINIKKDDIVNMYTAKMTGAPVLIVGDIDKGGVFASLVGTIELFDDWERDITAGFIINKFRGDASQLKSGTDFLEKRTGKHVFGIVPYIADLKIPDEDSVEFKQTFNRMSDTDKTNIAIIDLPHISNHTDFDPFKNDNINIYLTSDTSQIDKADIIILPGSKNVIYDIDFIDQKGISGKILEMHRKGTSIIGICGGYQMLGRQISDPGSIESAKKTARGLGILDMKTEMGSEKTLKQTTAMCTEGFEVTGYEIHHGRTISNERPFITDQYGNNLGCINISGNAWGTYLHGIFEDKRFRQYILNKAVKDAAICNSSTLSIYAELGKLAAIFRENLDIDRIYKIMELR